MLEKSKRSQDCYSIDGILKSFEINCGGEPTQRRLLEFMLGDGMYGGEYTVYKYERSKKKLWQRVNCFWVYPLFMLSAPLQFLFYGQIGANKNSRVGKVLNFLVGFDR